MKIGIIGLGRMGFGMAERLHQNNMEVVGYNRSPAKTDALKEKGIEVAYEIEELLSKLTPEKKIVWLMLPTGGPTEDMIKLLLGKLNPGDIIINGANSFYKDAEEQATWCKEKDVHLFDCGVSGGVWGLENGYTLMIGGDKEEFHYIEPFCKALAPEKGYGFFGEVGKGFYVKSVHNIVEYVYLQGLAEGVELLEKRDIDIAKATEVWGPASVVKSWLLDLTTKALRRDDFDEIAPKIGSVTIKELKDTKESVEGYAPAFDVSTQIREDNSDKFTLGKRTIAAVRNEFGGHAVEK